jgi:hypothetical protein
LRAFYTARHPDDPEMVEDIVAADHEMYAHSNCAAYVDFTDDAAAEAYCRDCAYHLNWDYRRLPGDPSLLRDLLTAQWDDRRFLIVPPPSRQLVLASDGGLSVG